MIKHCQQQQFNKKKADKFCVNSKYLQNYTNDGFITMQLTEVYTWNQHQNIIRLLQQMQRELSEAFPFFEKKSSIPSYQNNMGQNNPQQQNQNNYQQNYNNQYQNSNPSSSYNSPHSSYNKQQGNNNYNPSYNQGVPNPLGQPQGNYMGNQGQQQQNNDQQKVQNQLKRELDVTLNGLLEEFNEEKNSSDQIYTHKQNLDENEATINQMEEELKGKINSINQQISSLRQFIVQNDQVSVNKDNVLNYIKEKNPLQTQILELTAEQDSIKETILYAEDAFKQRRIDFDSYLKILINYSEKEFINKVLIKKCIDQAKK